jgi:hypothetical protein
LISYSRIVPAFQRVFHPEPEAVSKRFVVVLGASQYAPGREQKKPGGASELSPSDKMNDARGKGGR